MGKTKAEEIRKELNEARETKEPKVARQWLEHPRRKHEQQRRQKPDGQNESKRNQKRAK